MDDFVVLLERHGLKPQGKSAPMASLKRSVNPNNGEIAELTSYGSSHSAWNTEFNIGSKFEGGDSGGFDGFAVFDELNKFSSIKSAKSWNQNRSNDLGKNETSFDELIPGFGGSGQPSNSATATWAVIADDPFEYLPSTLVNPSSVRSPRISSVDDLAEFAMDSLQCSSLDSDNAGIYREAEDVEEKKQEFGVDDLDSIFIPGPRSSSATTETSCKQEFGLPKERYNEGSLSTKKPAAPAHVLDDFSPLFGDDPFLGEFKEIPGESEKRRIARWEREQRIKKQMDKAVSDMNNLDRQIQIEQEERSRISETLDAEIKLWAAGKEGNMRALLSSLHLVLWPGCGWEAVSLTDLITCAAVKKVYKKANLYVHPDKVHQKGAQQKYIAEKVFNILKEAWNKFNKEELS